MSRGSRISRTWGWAEKREKARFPSSRGEDNGLRKCRYVVAEWRREKREVAWVLACVFATVEGREPSLAPAARSTELKPQGYSQFSVVWSRPASRIILRQCPTVARFWAFTHTLPSAYNALPCLHPCRSKSISNVTSPKRR